MPRYLFYITPYELEDTEPAPSGDIGYATVCWLEDTKGITLEYQDESLGSLSASIHATTTMSQPHRYLGPVAQLVRALL